MNATERGRLARLVENERIFRAGNRLIEERAADLGPDATIPFFCECSDESCTTQLPMTLLEYTEAHEDDTTFVIRPGHEALQVEDVVDENDRFVVVQKRL